MLKIIADENIALARDAFGRFGELLLLPGREITARAVRQADILLVRSITRVDRELLQGAAVRFVGTATTGTEHIDTGYLQQAGIAFAGAHGCNAEAVAEYVLTALAWLAVHTGMRLAGKTIGIVGAGQIGGRVAKYARALGMRVRLNDPPRQRSTGANHFQPLETLLEADILTLHVPLTRTGEDPTYHLLDVARLARLRPDVVLINTSRGAVIDNAALLDWRIAHPAAHLLLDVWEHEPAISLALLQQATLATPHIAGYSFEGKINGTWMLHEALCRFLGVAGDWQPSSPPIPQPVLNIPGDAGLETALHSATQQVYDIAADDRNLRRLLSLPGAKRNSYFDGLRKNYPVRREFANFVLRFTPANPELARTLQTVPFRVAAGREIAC